MSDRCKQSIRTLNGTWSYDKQLGVKIARYSRNINHPSRSNARVVPTGGKTDGSSWLSRSAVGKLNVLVDNNLIAEAFHDEGIKQVQVRSMGGLYKIVSFANKDVMQTVTESECLNGWFEYLKPWNGKAASTSRVVWLNCTGIPLEAWYFSTFKSIGSQWGNVLTLDRETSNRLSFDKGKGIVEKTAVVAMVFGEESELELVKDSEDEGSNDIANKEKYKQGNGFTESAFTTNKEVEESQHKLMKGGQVACFLEDSNIPLPNGPGEATTTSRDEGLVIINGLKYNGEEVVPETNTNVLEIVIGPFDKDPNVMVRNKESSHSQTVDREESSSINKRGDEETIKEMDEVAKSKSVDGIYQFTRSKEMPVSADLSSTRAMASTEGINQRNAAIIREAEETIKLGKILGIKFNGNEIEVCQKLKLISMWRGDKFKPDVTIIRKHFIISNGVYLDNFKCCIVNVYAPNDTGERKLLWEELLQLKSSFTDPWCLGGDLNEVKADAERSGYLNPSLGMDDLIEFIDVAELHDLPLVGRRFTWTNFQAHIKQSRLDRFLVSSEWCEKFKIRQWGLPRPISDHYLLLISDEEKDWGPKIFRFMDAWLSHPKFMSIVKDVWENTNVTGWKAKLKKILKFELREFSRLAEILCRQKSRVNWIKLGYKNTHFFQASSAARYHENFIGSVEVDGTWLEDPFDIKMAAVNFFSKLFNEKEW
ncbi:hypothetical protein Acr_00g0052930 [Actinidia rufa]|uniref:Endonuclease/exonuclease/phosphatase domain-containing protein n=1 Tax=Actinidia rufa TaxID=165716 RepID=A0A7J0DN62_9ERIC|nr:hypothetical protein Acr_00g0052930 [Actinidia rufa]